MSAVKKQRCAQLDLRSGNVHLYKLTNIYSANRWEHSIVLGSPNICVYKIPLNKIHYKIHFNNSSSCIFCFYIVHLSKWAKLLKNCAYFCFFNVVYDKKVTASIIKVSEFVFMLFILNFVAYFLSFSTISSGYVCSLAI